MDNVFFALLQCQRGASYSFSDFSVIGVNWFYDLGNILICDSMLSLDNASTYEFSLLFWWLFALHI